MGKKQKVHRAAFTYCSNRQDLIYTLCGVRNHKYLTVEDEKVTCGNCKRVMLAKMVKMVTIVPQEPKDGQFCEAQYTKVLTDGAEVNGIRRIQVIYETDQPVTAQIELYAYMKEVKDVAGRFVMRHPFEDCDIEVKQIVCGNGKVIDL